MEELYDRVNRWSHYSKYLKGNSPFISFIGAPYSGGQQKKGTEKTPNIFRDTYFFDLVEKETGLKIVDSGDVKPMETEEVFVEKLPNLKNMIQVSRYCQSLKEHVHQEIEKGGFSLTIGGDHSIAIGSFFSLYQYIF